jgi:hypothetical protein
MIRVADYQLKSAWHRISITAGVKGKSAIVNPKPFSHALPISSYSDHRLVAWLLCFFSW